MKEISQERKNMMALVAVILMIAAAGLLFQWYRASENSGVYAIIQYRGEVYDRLDLFEDTELRIEDSQGNYNVIRVEDGAVYVTEANCPDQICVYSGALSETGAVIACLPHDLLIYIESEGD